MMQNIIMYLYFRFDDINDLMPIIEKHFQNIPFQRFVNHVLDDTLINYVPQVSD